MISFIQQLLCYTKATNIQFDPQNGNRVQSLGLSENFSKSPLFVKSLVVQAKTSHLSCGISQQAGTFLHITFREITLSMPRKHQKVAQY